MRFFLGKLTGNRVTSALTGAFVTAVIQSSSVTTVLVVGFISAGLMSLSQSVGIIMGANVGTTITAQIIAFKVTKYAMILISAGFLMLFVSKRDAVRQIGGMVMGLGLIFFGMDLMSGATTPLRQYDPFIDFMREIDNPLLGILFGAVFTALVQSSSATTGIVIALASQGFVSLEAGIALALGANVGTCVTALLASLGKQREALQAAFVDVLYNVIGAGLWVGLIWLLADIVRDLSPAAEGLSGMERLAAETPRQIANAHTIFNVMNTVVFLPFTVPLAKLVKRLLPLEEVEDVLAKPKYLDAVYLDTPALAIERLRLEIGRLGDVTNQAVHAAMPFHRETIEARVADGESLARGILEYARTLGSRRLPKSDAWHLDHLLSVVTNLQSIGDTMRFNLGELMRQAEARKLAPSESTREFFRDLHVLVREAVSGAVKAVEDIDLDTAEKVVRMKKKIIGTADRLNRHLGRRLVSDDPDRLATYRLESQAVEVLKRVYYFAKRIARTVGREVEELEVPSVAAD
jgi:phosphate:Na+ symporter